MILCISFFLKSAAHSWSICCSRRRICCCKLVIKAVWFLTRVLSLLLRCSNRVNSSSIAWQKFSHSSSVSGRDSLGSAYHALHTASNCSSTLRVAVDRFTRTESYRRKAGRHYSAGHRGRDCPRPGSIAPSHQTRRPGSCRA